MRLLNDGTERKRVRRFRKALTGFFGRALFQQARLPVAHALHHSLLICF